MLGFVKAELKNSTHPADPLIPAARTQDSVEKKRRQAGTQVLLLGLSRRRGNGAKKQIGRLYKGVRRLAPPAFFSRCGAALKIPPDGGQTGSQTVKPKS